MVSLTVKYPFFLTPSQCTRAYSYFFASLITHDQVNLGSENRMKTAVKNENRMKTAVKNALIESTRAKMLPLSEHISGHETFT